MRASVEPHELPTQSTSPFLSVPIRRGPCDHGSGLPVVRWERVAVGAIMEGLVELAVLWGGGVELILERRQRNFGHLAGRHVGLADGVERHLRPPAIAVAVTRGAIGAVGALGVLERQR